MTVAAESESAPSRSRIVSGSFWTLVSHGGSLITRLASNLVLAWLLAPSDFGLAAIIFVILIGMSLLSDVGIDASIIRSERGEDPRYYNTAWTVQIVRGAILWAVTFAVAPLIAGFYDEPSLGWLLPLAGVSLLISGFQGTSFASLQRRLRIGTFAAIVLSQYIVTAVVAIVWALKSPSVVALVIGHIAGSVTKTVLTHLVDRTIRNRLAWDPAAFSDIFHFGKWVFVTTAFFFLANQSDRLILGKLASKELLGVYHLAMMVAQIPFILTVQLAARVVYPVLSHHARVNQSEMAARLHDARRAMLPAALVATVSLIALAPPFFTYLYRDDYHGAGHLAVLLAGVFWINILTAVIDRAPLALGDSRAPALTMFVSFVARFALSIVGFKLYGIAGFIGGLTLGALFGYATLMLLVRRYGINTLPTDVKYTALLVAVVAVYLLVENHVMPAGFWPDVLWPAALVAVAAAWGAQRLAPLIGFGSR